MNAAHFIHSRTLLSLLTVFVLGGILLFSPQVFAAQTAQSIQKQINTHNSSITSLQNEISTYQKQLNVLGVKKTTLQSTLYALSLSRKKLTASLSVTKNQVSNTTLKLDQLESAINKTKSTITAHKDAITSALRTINQNDANSGLAQILATDGFTAAWMSADQLEQFNHALGVNVKILIKEKKSLTTTYEQVTTTKNRFVSLQNNLVSKQRSVAANTQAHKTLLYQTKNKESVYQKLIARKKAAEKVFEQELESLQSQLKLIVHPGLLPPVGKGVLAWPFSTKIMNNCAKRSKVFGNIYCITQYFGNTRFATKNAQVYSGHGHNGIDLGVPIGTPVRAALSGTILATGDTDLSHDPYGKQCWSFGKWIMIAHANGLNTMYAHLSKRVVTKGVKVTTGQIIGYSGMTGYATGPHLHFGVYAAEGTKIMTFGDFKGVVRKRCTNALMPVATIKAYLNPLSYLIQASPNSHSFTTYK